MMIDFFKILKIYMGCYVFIFLRCIYHCVFEDKKIKEEKQEEYNNNKKLYGKKTLDILTFISLIFPIIAVLGIVKVDLEKIFKK